MQNRSLLQIDIIREQVFKQIEDGYIGGQVFGKAEDDKDPESYWWSFDVLGNLIID